MFRSAVVKLKQGLLFRGLLVYTFGRCALAALYVHVLKKILAAVGTRRHHRSIAVLIHLAARTVVHHDVLFH